MTETLKWTLYGGGTHTRHWRSAAMRDDGSMGVVYLSYERIEVSDGLWKFVWGNTHRFVCKGNGTAIEDVEPEAGVAALCAYFAQDIERIRAKAKSDIAVLKSAGEAIVNAHLAEHHAGGA